MYKKYGDEWEKEVMKNSKKTIVEMLRRVAIERDGLEAVEHKMHPTAFGVCPHGVNLGNQVCVACEPEKIGGG